MKKSLKYLSLTLLLSVNVSCGITPEYREYYAKDPLNMSTGYILKNDGYFLGESLNVPAFYESEEVVGIGDYEYSRSSNLKEVTLNVQTDSYRLGKAVFQNCIELKKVNFIGKGKAYIDETVFRGTELDTLTVDGIELVLTALGLTFELKCDRLVLKNGAKISSSEEIPSFFTTIDLYDSSLDSITADNVNLYPGANYSRYAKNVTIHLDDSNNKSIYYYSYCDELTIQDGLDLSKCVFSYPSQIRLVEIAEVINLGKGINYIPDSFFGNVLSSNNYLKINYEGSLEEFNKIEVSNIGNNNYFEGRYNLICKNGSN